MRPEEQNKGFDPLLVEGGQNIKLTSHDDVINPVYLSLSGSNLIKLPVQSKWTMQFIGVQYTPYERDEPTAWQRFWMKFFFGVKWFKVEKK